MVYCPVRGWGRNCLEPDFADKKKPRPLCGRRGLCGLRCFPLVLVGRADGARRTNVGTSAAVYANIGVDGVDCAAAGSAEGTFVDASATSDAVAADYVWHVVLRF